MAACQEQKRTKAMNISTEREAYYIYNYMRERKGAHPQINESFYVFPRETNLENERISDLEKRDDNPSLLAAGAARKEEDMEI